MNSCIWICSGQTCFASLCKCAHRVEATHAHCESRQPGHAAPTDYARKEIERHMRTDFTLFKIALFRHSALTLGFWIVLISSLCVPSVQVLERVSPCGWPGARVLFFHSSQWYHLEFEVSWIWPVAIGYSFDPNEPYYVSIFPWHVQRICWLDK